MVAIIRKELADYFTSIRGLVLFLLAIVAAALSLYAANQGIRGSTESEFVFLRLFTTEVPNMPFASLLMFVNFVALFFIPIMGISLGFDAINSERSSGTLSRLLAQPVYRDNVINAKFLAGLVTLTLSVVTAMLLIAGYGLRMIGIPPSPEEFIRLFIFGVFTIVYGAFWMGLAILFSTLFRRIASSLLLSLGVWFVLGLLYVVIIVPVAATSINMYLTLMRLSPSSLFNEAAMVLLTPQSRGMAILTVGEADFNFILPNPLSLGQSLLVVWPQLVTLIALTALCFAISYVLFMRQEVRST